jgi:hypothetical protein
MPLLDRYSMTAEMLPTHTFLHSAQIDGTCNVIVEDMSTGRKSHVSKDLSAFDDIVLLKITYKGGV